MTVPNWPAALPQFPKRDEFTGGPVDSRVRFKTETGPPSFRARTTADPELYDATFRNLRQADLATFRAFYSQSLTRGTRSFSWRDPVYGDAALWKIMGQGELAYSVVARGADLHDMSLKLMRMPGAPWWGPYLRPAESIVPQVVADWDAGVYGVGGQKRPASALPLIAGTFNVWSVSTSDVETYSAGVVITAGDIPATAPGGVKRRVYFTP